MQVEDVSNKLSELSESAQASMESGKEGLEQADAYVRQMVRQYPAATLFGFLTLGYAVGRLVARR